MQPKAAVNGARAKNKTVVMLRQARGDFRPKIIVNTVPLDDERTKRMLEHQNVVSTVHLGSNY